MIEDVLEQMEIARTAWQKSQELLRETGRTCSGSPVLGPIAKALGKMAKADDAISEAITEAEEI